MHAADRLPMGDVDEIGSGTDHVLEARASVLKRLGDDLQNGACLRRRIADRGLARWLAGVLPALAEASRTIGSPQIRNRGTLGGNLGTASPAGDAVPPLLVYEADVVLASAARGVRVVPLARFLTGPKQNALLPDELIVAVRLEPREMRQTFMKVGPRNAMVIAVVSLAVRVDPERGSVWAAFGSAAPGAAPAGRVDSPEDLAYTGRR